MEIITSHISTDFDGLASMVAAKKLYPQAELYFPGTPEQSVRDFLSLYKDFFTVKIIRDPKDLPISKLIIVDTSNPNRLGPFRDIVTSPQIEVHIYDHHPPSVEDIRGDVSVNEYAGATTTILMEKLIEKKIPLTPLEATLMALGIYEETGSLLFADTTPRDALVVAELLKMDVNLAVVSDYVFHHLNEAQHALLNQLLSNSYVLRIKGFRILIAHTVTEKFIEGLALVTHRLQDLERMDAIFTIVQMGDRVYLVSRSIRTTIDVNQIASVFEGGGHPSAASAVIRNTPIEEIEEKLKKALKRYIEPMVRARDIMSKPVQTLELHPGMTLNDAKEYMYRVGHSNLPLTREGRLVGIVNRRDMEKADRHNYGNAPLEVYMSKPVVTTKLDASLFQLQNIMMEKGVSSLPVLEEDKLLGIVTRADVLEAVYRRDLSGMRKRELHPVNLLKSLPVFLREILYTAGKIGDQLHMGVYVVGGFVRDLLLGKENLDVDLVIEGDGMQFGEALAKDLKGRTRVHERFGTSVVILPDGMHIDVATSRTEYYTRPAALPEVMESSIKQDLYRRDFTINAAAIQLNRRNYGKLLDFFGSRKDIRNGIVRVLHPMSFIDDPTRILRAVKFEKRFHFRMDQSTESFMKEALKQNIFDHVSAERLRNELIEILEESRPLPAVKRMDQLKILRVIHPGIHLNSRMEEQFKAATATLVQFDELVKHEDVKRWIIYFNVLVTQLDTGEIEKIGEKFRVPKNIISRVSFDRKQVNNIIRILSERFLNSSDIYRTLEGLSLETLLFLISRTRITIVRSRIARYLNQLRHIKPIIRGQDLITWGVKPGPMFRKILSILFDAQLDNMFTTREGACEFYQSRLRSLVHNQ